MNQGWFGNADVAGGTEDRYMGRFMLNRFVDKTQVSLVGSANNVNGLLRRWRRSALAQKQRTYSDEDVGCELRHPDEQAGTGR